MLNNQHPLNKQHNTIHINSDEMAKIPNSCESLLLISCIIQFKQIDK